MNRKQMGRLHHPLGVHIPAMVLLVYMAASIIAELPLPARVPLQWGESGHVSRWGSSGEALVAFGTVFAIGLLFLGIGVALDEQWARGEAQKRFNWGTPLDEVVIGLLTGLTVGTAPAVKTLSEHYTLPWELPLALMVAGAAAAAALEAMRPFRPYGRPAASSDISQATEQFRQQVGDRSSWAYFESQNPAYIVVMVLAVAVSTLAGAVQSWKEAPVITILLVACALLILLVLGGLRVTVSPRELVVRLGVMGVRLLKLPVTEITEVQVYKFSPLTEFGGWGIRRNAEMTAFYFCGTRGVKVTTAQGKKFLVGSNNPERLAAAITQAVDMAQGRSSGGSGQ